MIKFRRIRYPAVNVPIATGVYATDNQLNSYRIAERNLSRRELVIAERPGSDTFISGRPFNAWEGQIAGGALALETNNFGQSVGPPMLTLRDYAGELYAIGAFVPSDLQLGELIDTAQRRQDNVIPTVFITRFFKGLGAIPNQGPGVAPVKILEPDPNGLRTMVALYLAFGALFLTTSPTPGDTRSTFQYGVPGGGIVTEPLVWTWPYVPRGGLFATADPGGHRLYLVEGFGR